MSRPVKKDYDFDRNRIVNLFIKAKGGRSRAQFAQDAGVSLAFISAMTHDKFSEPPIPSTLKKIADSTKDVSFTDLLICSGYCPMKYGQCDVVDVLKTFLYLFPDSISDKTLKNIVFKLVKKGLLSFSQASKIMEEKS